MWTLIQESDLQRPAQPVVQDGNIALLSGVATQDVELLDLQTLKAQFPARRLAAHGLPVLSPRGKQVTCGSYLVDLQTGQTKHLAAPAYCLVNRGRWLASRRCDMATFRQGSGLWQLRVALPFVRHWYKSAGGQVVLLDVETGKEICASPAYQNEAFTEIIASADGRHVLGASAGKFRVWRVPDGE
jgi:hypothetical protein